MRLYHVSEDPGIARFEPRPHPTWPDLEPRIWAIAESHLPNYLLPRDCPRVTFHAGAGTSWEDVRHFLGGNRSTWRVLVEKAWLPKLESTQLCLYELDPDGFSEFDAVAGYWTSRQHQVPKSMSLIDDLKSELARHGVELEARDVLWDIHDTVAASTLQFSMIRMRNAKPRNTT